MTVLYRAHLLLVRNQHAGGNRIAPLTRIVHWLRLRCF